MPSLNDCMKKIRKLVKEKGHEDTIDAVPLKLLFAIVEIGEAVDIWKKHSFDELSIDDMLEEMIDSIFYILDAYGIILRKFPEHKTPDEMFDYKMKKNLRRPYYYGRA